MALIHFQHRYFLWLSACDGRDAREEDEQVSYLATLTISVEQL